jgi:hypothetical protein
LKIKYFAVKGHIWVSEKAGCSRYLKNYIFQKIYKSLEVKNMRLKAATTQYSKFKSYHNIAILFLILFCVLSCSATYSQYSSGIFYGKAALTLGEYKDAKQYFEEASKHIRDSQSLSYLAIVDYKMNDLDNAEKLIREAEKIECKASLDHLRILGYKALIILKRNNNEGLIALKEYMEAYKYCYPLPSLYYIEKMSNKKEIQFDKLEKLIEEQISTYDNNIEQYHSTRTGYRTTGK